MGSNRRNALNILKGEKEILQYYLTFTESNIVLLDMDEASFTIATAAASTENSYASTVLSELMRKKPRQRRFLLRHMGRDMICGTKHGRRRAKITPIADPDGIDGAHANGVDGTG